MPGLLRAYAPRAATGTDRKVVTTSGLTVGRSPAADWPLEDGRLSKKHASFRFDGDQLLVEDLDSTNGTFINGERLGGRRALEQGDLVRCGQCLLVACDDLSPLGTPGRSLADTSMAGRFFAPVLLARLGEAASVGRHVLLSGESGTGKELAAQGLAQQAEQRGGYDGQFVAHNCARFATEEEATSTIFGVQEGVFSGVKARPGLLEEAANGVLFLDEAHALPLRVQRSLLRFAEDAVFSQIGETKQRELRVLLVLGTNMDIETATEKGALAFDLVNRLQHVELLPLAKRRADIPDIFAYQLQRAAAHHSLDGNELLGAMHPDQVEAICLLSFEQRNVRELIHVAEALAARVALRGEDPRLALGKHLAKQYPENPVVRRYLAESKTSDEAKGAGWSHYEQHREAIIDAYRKSGNNLSATVRTLQDQGVRASRRWLADYLSRWGVR